MSIDGLVGEVREELEESRDELRSQLLSLYAGFGRIDDSLVIFHILPINYAQQQQRQNPKHHATVQNKKKKTQR